MNTELMMLIVLLLGQVHVGLLLWLSIKHRKQIKQVESDMEKQSRFASRQRETNSPREAKPSPRKRSRITWEY